MHRDRKWDRDYQRLGGGGMRSYYLRGPEFLFGMMRKIEMDGDDGCITLRMNTMPLNCT